jgi:hypothetical protein
MVIHFSRSPESIEVSLSFLHTENHKLLHQIAIGDVPPAALPHETAILVDVRIGVYVDDVGYPPLLSEIHPEVAPTPQRPPSPGG